MSEYLLHRTTSFWLDRPLAAHQMRDLINFSVSDIRGGHQQVAWEGAGARAMPRQIMS